MQKPTRREFLKTTALAGAALTLPAVSWARVRGANETIRVACVGIRSRGRAHIDGLQRLEGVEVVALCDVDRKVLADNAVRFHERHGGKVETFVDIRDMLEREDIDVVAIASPNHWHALGAVWALQAGKDVYLEKPVSHNVWEGRQIVRHARKLGRIVQAGTQSRSNPGMQKAVAYVRAGELGKIERVRGLCYKPRMSIGKVAGPVTVAEHIDYDLWLGPAPQVPLRRKNLHYDWHWDFATGNGDLGNQGIHQMDIARWLLGVDALSPRVMSVGGRVGYDDDGNTPNTQVIFHDYPDAPLIFEVRGLPRSREHHADGKAWRGNMPDYRGVRIGVVCDCEGGSVVIGSYSGARALDREGKEIRKFEGGADHFANFIAAVRSRRAGDLNADIEEGHLSSALCHTGNISHLLGRARSPEEIVAAVEDDGEARETYGRMAEHLATNGIDLQKTPVTLGPWLRMDPASERFVGDEAANALLSREYREPFVIPEVT